VVPRSSSRSPAGTHAAAAKTRSRNPKTDDTWRATVDKEAGGKDLRRKRRWISRIGFFMRSAALAKEIALRPTLNTSV
jgi:hypothetical protein